MGQQEILQFLKEKYAENKAEWFSAKDILEGLQERGVIDGPYNRVHICLMQLSTYKLIKFKGVGMWQHKKLFQYRK